MVRMSNAPIPPRPNATPLRLVAFDMEGTLADNPTVWEIMHRKLGTWESHGLKYWQRYLAGEIAYDDFARLDVEVWKGAPETLLVEAVRAVPLMAGCADLLSALHARGVHTAIISNGLLRTAERLVREHGVRTALANRARTRSGRLTGGLDILVPYDAKGIVLQQLMAQLRVLPEHTAAVGDSRSDGAMFEAAGMGIAFRPSDDHVAQSADHVVEAGDLRQVGHLLLTRPPRPD